MKKLTQRKVGTVYFFNSNLITIITTDNLVFTIDKVVQKEFSKYKFNLGDIVYLICDIEKHKVLTLMDAKIQDDPGDC